MGEQTTGDIAIAAEPAEIMAVIADFDAYPEWATGVKETEVVTDGADGRAEQVRFVLDATPIRDEYVLAYDWNGDESVTWTLAQGRMIPDAFRYGVSCEEPPLDVTIPEPALPEGVRELFGRTLGA